MRVLFLSVLATLVATDAVPAAVKVPVEGTDRWRVRYDDSLLSVNDTCPVARRGLNTKLDPLYVNGRPLGFC